MSIAIELFIGHIKRTPKQKYDPFDWIFGNRADSVRKESIHLDYGKKKPGRPEKLLEALIGKFLEDQGIDVHYQVSCDAGVADIVTPDTIYEVKRELDPAKVFSAIGQVMVYRAHINPSAKAIVIGYAYHKRANQIAAIQAISSSFGVEIRFWEKEDE